MMFSFEVLPSSVADPHHLHTDLNPSFHFDADPADAKPDLSFQFDADSHPTTQFFPDLDPPMLQNLPLRFPTFHFDADPDPAFYFNADPDLQHCFLVNEQETRYSLEKANRWGNDRSVVKDGPDTKKEDEIMAGEPNVEASNLRRPPVRSYTHQSTTDNPTGKTGYPPITRNQSREEKNTRRLAKAPKTYDKTWKGRYDKKLSPCTSTVRYPPTRELQ
jgi:hypothetical protein